MNPLESHHLKDLRNSELNDKTIAEAGFTSLTAEETRTILGFDAGPGWGFEYPSLNGGPPFIRVKPDKPSKDKDGRPKKYLTAKGAGNRLYIPATLLPHLLSDSSNPLLITEGEKKALKAAQEGFNCIALAGVSCYRQKDKGSGESVPIPDLDKITWKDRTVYLVYDSDLAKKPDVQKAESALAEELWGRGAIVKLGRLPGGQHDEKVGLDDFLISHGPKALEVILEKAVLFTKPGFPCTDMGNAERLAAHYGQTLKYCYDWRAWLHWDGQRWQKDNKGRVEQQAKKTIRSIYQEASQSPDEEHNKEIAKHAIHSQKKIG